MHRQHLVQSSAHVGIAGDFTHAVGIVQAFGFLMTPCIEGQQGRILERKHGKGAHQDIAHGDRGVGGTMIGHPGQILADNGKQGIGIQMCTHFEFAKCSGCLAVTVEAILEGRHSISPCK